MNIAGIQNFVKVISGILLKTICIQYNAGKKILIPTEFNLAADL